MKEIAEDLLNAIMKNIQKLVTFDMSLLQQQTASQALAPSSSSTHSSAASIQGNLQKTAS